MDMLLDTLLAGVCKAVNPGAALISLSLIHCIPRAKIRKSRDVYICDSVKIFSNVSNDLYYGIFDV